MRQRVMIAMALALEPRIVILDEPTTALDVVTQREILEELIALRDRLGFAVLFITHDLSLLVEVADSIAVMYAGRIVERARPSALFRAPRHPYTLGLLSSFPPLHGAAPADDRASPAPRRTCGRCRRAASSTPAAATRWTGAGPRRRPLVPLAGPGRQARPPAGCRTRARATPTGTQPRRAGRRRTGQRPRPAAQRRPPPPPRGRQRGGGRPGRTR